MLSRKIEFSIHKNLEDIENIKPQPAKNNIPDWYKSLPMFHTKFQDPTLKACVPFLDSLTAGYLLPMPQDMIINFNHLDENGERAVSYQFANQASEETNALGLNLNTHPEFHPKFQLGDEEHVYHKKNKGFPYAKILNPWIIKTPPGYSCLFIPPMHRSQDYFSILPGIVDTDTFDMKINFPFVLHGHKHEEFKVLIKQGTPYVQIIPFKRNNWTMSFKTHTNEHKKNLFKYNLNLIHKYRNKYWNKKSWK